MAIVPLTPTRPITKPVRWLTGFDFCPEKSRGFFPSLVPDLLLTRPKWRPDFSRAYANYRLQAG